MFIIEVYETGQYKVPSLVLEFDTAEARNQRANELVGNSYSKPIPYKTARVWLHRIQINKLLEN